MKNDELMDKKGSDIKKSLTQHLTAYFYQEIKNLFKSLPKMMYFFFVAIVSASVIFSIFLSGNGKKMIIDLMAGGNVFYLAIFAVLLSTFAIFQAFLSSKFVKISHDTGKKNNLDPLYELGKQFLFLTSAALILYLVSIVAQIMISSVVLPIILEIVPKYIFKWIGFVCSILYVILSLIFVSDVFSMIYNLWKTLANYSAFTIIEEEKKDDIQQ